MQVDKPLKFEVIGSQKNGLDIIRYTDKNGEQFISVSPFKQIKKIPFIEA